MNILTFTQSNDKEERMDTIKSIITLTLFSLVLTLSSVQAAAPQPGIITGGSPYEIPGWFKESFLEIAEDVVEAEDEGKHVLLFFHLNGCPYCDRMANENFDREPLKSQIQQNFDAIALNIKGDREIAMNEDLITTERQLSEHLKVQYTPTIIFLNSDNRTVLRLNGYRSPEAMKQALDYVQSKAYLNTSFSDYKRANMQYGQYKLVDDPLFSRNTDLSRQLGPVALLFEDDDCNECGHFHQKMMQRPEIRAALKRFTLIRVDAKSTHKMTGFDGKPTTARELAATLDINYRPGIVLFDGGKEINRVESMLYPWHLENVLLHVLDNNYKTYPGYLDLARVRQEKRLAEGKDVNVGKPTDW